jgi:hypothetical protein
VARRELVGWLSSTRPDVVMMHLGTNDVWNNQSPAQVLAAYGTMVDWMRESKRSMKILVRVFLGQVLMLVDRRR